MIRKATIDDLSKISEIASNAWKTNYKGIIDEDFLETRTVENFIKRGLETKWLEDDKIDTFVFEENNSIKGFISGNDYNKNNWCEIGRLYVDPEFQNQGIGKKLLEYMEKHYGKTGYKDMVIWTIKGLPNNDFYRKFGKTMTEEKEYTYGNKKYTGIGFLISLKNEEM